MSSQEILVLRVYILPMKNYTLSAFFGLLFTFCVSQIYAQPCIDGMAGDYPCDLIDQQSVIPGFTFQAPNLNDVWGWTSPITGREYAIQGVENKTSFIDITSPQYPIYLGYLPTESVGSLWRDIKVIDNYAYIVSEAPDHGMQVFDLTRLESLVSTQIPFEFNPDAVYDSFGNCHNIVADTANKFVYAVGTNTFSGGLHVIDVSDPLNPSFAGGSAGGGYCHDAQVLTYTGPDEDYTGQEICLGFNAGLVVVYNVTDKSDIQLISIAGYDDVGYVHQGWFTEDLRYAISNDETDEVDFGITTRSIIWDMSDLDNPEVLEYVDLGTTSVDHNLYIEKDMVYQSNYTSGLRVFDLLEIEDGHLEPFGFFDVFPNADNNAFVGSWSNYPYFESGYIPVSNMYGSFHVVKPRFFELPVSELRVCNDDQASTDFFINRRIFGDVNYSVEMESGDLTPELMVDQTDGAPAMNSLSFSNLGDLDAGYYSGSIVISYGLEEERLPFVLIKEEGEPLEAPELLFPIEGELIPTQEVTFQFSDNTPGYARLQVSLNESFTDIVYEEIFYGSEPLEVNLPLDLSTYFWRLIKPSACGDDLVSDVQSFVIDESANTSNIAESSIKSIYPNPGLDIITISATSNTIENYEIFDISGRLIQSVNSFGQSGNMQIDISELSPGVYFIKARKNELGKKFVKQ